MSSPRKGQGMLVLGSNIADHALEMHSIIQVPNGYSQRLHPPHPAAEALYAPSPRPSVGLDSRLMYKGIVGGRLSHSCSWRGTNVAGPYRLSLLILSGAEPRPVFEWGGRDVLSPIGVDDMRFRKEDIDTL